MKCLLLIPLVPLAIVLVGMFGMFAVWFLCEAVTRLVVAPSALIIWFVAPTTRIGKKCKEWLDDLI